MFYCHAICIRATSQMLGSLFCCSLKIVPAILFFQSSTISSAHPWLIQTSVWSINVFSRQAGSFNSTLFSCKRRHQSDYELQTGSVENTLKEAFLKTRTKGRCNYFS